MTGQGDRHSSIARQNSRVDADQNAWRTSRASADQGACVEVAACRGSSVLVRDSRDRSGVVLELTSAQWRDLVTRLRGGRLGGVF